MGPDSPGPSGTLGTDTDRPGNLLPTIRNASTGAIPKVRRGGKAGTKESAQTTIRNGSQQTPPTTILSPSLTGECYQPTPTKANLDLIPQLTTPKVWSCYCGTYPKAVAAFVFQTF
ncbi:hypothetical protein QE152_g40504 [Popillia japonica]|uniref:Uncharacterized protein n=1 Tax=Popillia japonica TaxID=7064 RepID=A0AAW1HG02_POPJA